MQVDVSVLLRHEVELPRTAVCRIEVRDVTNLDEASETLSVHEAPVAEVVDGTVLTTRMEIPDVDNQRRSLTVWARLSMAGGKRTQKGDYVTTAAYPVDSRWAIDRVVVELQRVGPPA